ncbi:sulfur carrier protein [Hydrogenivirga caldilitoris]|uniref:Sulfur carrier protein n=1 Tax=Hydrogenivirga caldilitoris TaxID=246264 RepID=A0A497XQ55_9AQUI|nr:MoaD/ThiS family protein [Hydrogenivirga caldilitoris]RLJ71095.1 sulfur carrier protein [Hydrogenivirga caldilitoris]
MSIKVLYRGKEIELPENKLKAKELLRRLGLSPLSSLVIKNNEVISEDDYVEEGDNIRVINAISGGV